MSKLKGFVGPLGDDLPSIFPIVAGVLLFVASLLYANNLVDEKNQQLDTRKAALGLSYIVTEKGLIDDAADFKSVKCEDQLQKFAASTRVNFLVTVKRFCQGIRIYQQGSPPQESPYFLDESRDLQARTWMYCTNVEGVPRGQIMDVPAHAVALSYPVAVTCPEGDLPLRGLGMITVAAWKGKTA
ncbi:hypothetical protein HY572_02185 [Candidatus Micrarchaeota archaeon]|nr:hypothetical protein [Candidatus Micrarchaeota archaeon]